MYAWELSYLFYDLLNTIWFLLLTKLRFYDQLKMFDYKRQGKNKVILLKNIRTCVMFNVIVSTGQLKTYYDNNVILSSNQNI